MSGFVKAAKLSELREGGMKMVTVDGLDVCLIMSGGKVHAVDNVCTHEDAPLNEGHIEGTEIVCPWHQARFDFRTGKADKKTDWAKRDLNVYEVRVEGDDVLVKA